MHLGSTVALLGALAASTALVAPTHRLRTLRRPRAADGDTEVFEALDDDDDATAAPAPANDDFTPDEDDPTQQTRVLTYMGLSLLPIIGLVPVLRGARLRAGGPEARRLLAYATSSEQKTI